MVGMRGIQRGLIGALAAVTLAACGPWLTPIPTYWDPVRTPRVATEERQEEPMVVEVEPTPPPPPAPAPLPVAKKEACTAIYVVSSEKGLLAFHPDDGRVEERGRLQCPSARFTSPFSMAVARDGTAQVLYSDGHMFRVDVEDASCAATDFRPMQEGFRLFGMGFAADPQGGSESLYVAELSFRGRSKGLARIDVESGKLHFIGPFSSNPGHNLELTPAGEGPLVGYFLNTMGQGGTLVEISRVDGTILKEKRLPVGTRASALAIAWWRGAYYIFTSPRRGTDVHRYDPEKDEVELVTTIDQTVVGAGVSTCAPDAGKPVPSRSAEEEAQPGGWRELPRGR